ncbi:hypothetical protein HN873_051808, partial [Arachis hypogaea]
LGILSPVLSLFHDSTLFILRDDIKFGGKAQIAFHERYQVSRQTSGCNAILFTSSIKTMKRFSPWKVEILDRVLLYEGTEEAHRLWSENGWDVKVSCIRQLQIALDYFKFDEIERSLKILMDVNLVEEGILRLLFAAVFLIVNKNGNDSETSAASGIATLDEKTEIRLLALATSVAKEASLVIKETPVLVQDSAKIKEAPPAPNRKSLELDQMLRI